MSSLDSTTIASVFLRYYELHAINLRTATDAMRAIGDWLDFLEKHFDHDASISEALEATMQQRFHDYLVGRGLSLASVRRILAVGKAALNFSYKRGEIEAPPYVQLVKPPQAQPKGRPLELEEVVELFAACHEPHVRLAMALMLGTASRPGAILDMTYAQIDIRHRLIDLNPADRLRTKKHRPIVKLPDQLFDFLAAGKNKTPAGPVIAYDGEPVKSIKTSWNKVRTRSGLPGKVTNYSFRHTIARWLRSQSVPMAEVASQLGHKSKGYETTEIYAPFDPAHLEQACSAIDLFLCQVAHQLHIKTMSDYLLKPA